MIKLSINDFLVYFQTIEYIAEGKELRGLDLSKVLVSKQRQKLNKKKNWMRVW